MMSSRGPRHEGSGLMVVPATSSSSKLFTSPKSSGNFSSFEQRERRRTFRDFNPDTLHGRRHRLVQSLKFNKVSLSSIPTDESTSVRRIQPSRIKHSRYVLPLKSGISRRFKEWLRLMVFKLCKCCKKKHL